MSDDFICLQCGDRFDERPILEMHWTVEGHAPADAAAKAVTRARDGAVQSEPDVSVANTLVQRRRSRFRLIPGGRA